MCFLFVCVLFMQFTRMFTLPPQTSVFSKNKQNHRNTSIAAYKIQITNKFKVFSALRMTSKNIIYPNEIWNIKHFDLFMQSPNKNYGTSTQRSYWYCLVRAVNAYEYDLPRHTELVIEEAERRCMWINYLEQNENSAKNHTNRQIGRIYTLNKQVNCMQG